MKQFLFLTLPIFLTACGGGKTAQQETPQADTAAAPQQAFILEKTRFNTAMQIPGELQPWQQVDLYAKVNGFVRKVYADVGTRARQGQLLAQMEAPEIGSQAAGAASRVGSLEALYAASKANYDRLLETSKTPGTISPNELDLASAKVKSDLAQLQAARSALKEVNQTGDYLQIRAPFSGIITSRSVNPGAYAGPSGKGSEFPLFTLQQQDRLRLVLSLPEAYSPYLHERDTLSFRVKALPGQVFHARVSRQAGSLDQRLRTERVEMDVDNSTGKLLPGMVAEISLSMNSAESSFVVPTGAIVSSQERTFVIRVSNKVASWVDIRRGRDAGRRSEVFGPLNAGDTLLTSATEEVRNKTPVSRLVIAKGE